MKLAAAGRVPTLDDLIPYLMNRIVSRLNQNLAEKLRSRRLTFQHWRVLAALYRSDGQTLSELVEWTVIPQSTLSRLVGRMAAARLVVRRPARRADSRFVEVWLTDRGRDVYEDIVPLALGEHAAALEGLSAEEVRLLAAMLRRVMRNLGIGPAG
ncbi:MAG: MarR family transcriptional regulator [Rhodospirillales bacterium]|nr:MarR family transcriptional regulator [Rhodospirillales bacterium]